MGVPTGYINSSGLDIGIPLVPKSYLIDRYPELADTFKQAGLWMWGYNTVNGQLGINNRTADRSSPVQTIAGGTNWKQISAFSQTVAAIKTDGTLWMWGLGQSGQLGNGIASIRSSPVQTVSSGTNWEQVSTGVAHTAAIKTDGTLWTWGQNTFGQLGTNNTIIRSSPIQTVSSGTNWKQISVGTAHTAAIKTDGTLWTWGYNISGQLGDNTIVEKSSPIQTISGGTNWKQVAGGTNNTAAIKTDGTLWLWGLNDTGNLGDNTVIPKSSPVQTVAGGTNWKQLNLGTTLGGVAGCTNAIKTDGTLWSWGRNQYGQLGDNTVVNKSSPIQTVAGGTNWKQVSTGQLTTAAIKTDGTLWTWGVNDYGVLGLGTTVVAAVSSPVQTIAGGTNWKQVAAGTAIIGAIQDNSADIFGNPL
jgi:alpha-tubulin suppressor-like RCC1 family protein